MKLTKYHFYAFFFGLGATITVRIVGLFAVSDIFTILALPFLISKKGMFNNKQFRIIIKLLLLWMLFTFFSDVVNETDLMDALKGFFTLLPFFSSLLFANWLLSINYRLILPFLWGLVISFILSTGLGLDAYYQESLVRNNVASISQLSHYHKMITWIISSFINGVFVIVFYKKKPRLVVFVLIIFSFLLLIQGNRSGFIINLLVSIILYVIIKLTSKLPWNGDMWRRKLKTKLPGFILMLLVAVFIGKNIYEFSVENGYLGEREKYKYEMQKNSKIGLLSGRGAIVAAILAINDSPILGHGSYAKDKKGFNFQASMLTDTDMRVIDKNYEGIGEDYIPAHSHLFQAWVNNGIFGALFWFYILYFVLIKFLRKHIFNHPQYFAYSLLSVFSTMWTILFSPFQQKPFLAMSLMFFVVLMYNKNKK